MKITFLGAIGCVTGSCQLLQANGKNILLDCGTFQGKDDEIDENKDFEFDPKYIDFVILSHAHIDHSGRIPILYKKGFKGEVICTKSTKDLSKIMLLDSGHILQYDCKFKNKERIKNGLPKLNPLYTPSIAQESINLFRGFNYNEIFTLCENIKIRFLDSGHLLGSAITEIYINENGKEIKLIYSGDLGNINTPILKNPTVPYKADYVIMESTYGDRNHSKISLELNELVNIINDTFKRGGNVIIPCFAIGRTQQIIYILNKYIENNSLNNIKVYVDSPLASKCTKIFEKHKKDFDLDAQNLIKKGDDPLNFKGLYFTEDYRDSININNVKKGAVIISSSGMCDCGRIRHHIKHNIERAECSIVFVGYQGAKTLGRKILDGAKTINLFGKELNVNCKIYNLSGLSCHADKQGLLNWLSNFEKKPNEVILVHGENNSRDCLKHLLIDNGYKCICPNIKDVINK